MQLQTLFRDLGKSEAMDAYLKEKIEAQIEQFLKNDTNANAMARVELERHRNQSRKPSFICEVVLKPSYQRKPIVVSKRGEDFHTAVNEAAAALKKILGRRSAKKAQHRRHEHSRELRELVAS